MTTQQVLNTSRSKFADIINEFTKEANLSNIIRLKYVKKICEEFIYLQTTSNEQNISRLITTIKDICIIALEKNDESYSTVTLLSILYLVKNRSSLIDYVGETSQAIKLLITELR